MGRGIIMLESLKKEVCAANIDLYDRGVVIYTWGNVSGIDRDRGLVVIKPSGVDYRSMTYDDMVVVELSTGRIVEGTLRPSSDTPTHLELYKAFPSIGGIAHTHSINSVAFAQAGIDIPVVGTTHADYFYGPVPCTRQLTENETTNDYELNTGRVIIDHFRANSIDVGSMPAILVRNHGPFTFGSDPMSSVYHAVVLETIAEMAYKTLLLSANAALPDYILEKHYLRKHGPDAYYGQN